LDGRPFAPRNPATRDGVGLKAGALLVREWNGALQRVMVLEKGFAWNGKTYSSLSQIAKAMTGTSWNGHRFFGLRPAGGSVGPKRGHVRRAKACLKGSRNPAGRSKASDALRVAGATQRAVAHGGFSTGATAASPVDGPTLATRVEIGVGIHSDRPEVSP
jgi:hypothetical protein